MHNGKRHLCWNSAEEGGATVIPAHGAAEGPGFVSLWGGERSINGVIRHRR